MDQDEIELREMLSNGWNVYAMTFEQVLTAAVLLGLYHLAATMVDIIAYEKTQRGG